MKNEMLGAFALCAAVFAVNEAGREHGRFLRRD